MLEAATQLRSTITCPVCNRCSAETMPTDACQFFYECMGCGTLLRPKPGDCCVFCSYGDVPCPPIQEARASGAPAQCCRADASGLK
ncbi:MAG TPA: GDCCVxC domain-containing (seleno)protein [Beijerinckiaceae bacterium]|nr:GDCCVxC domain-containing (seleno)protein [Beijerinckiaceae bacterium]